MIGKLLEYNVYIPNIFYPVDVFFTLPCIALCSIRIETVLDFEGNQDYLCRIQVTSKWYRDKILAKAIPCDFANKCFPTKNSFPHKTHNIARRFCCCCYCFFGIFISPRSKSIASHFAVIS